MKEAVQFSRTTIKYVTSNSRIIPSGGLLIPGQMLEAIGFDRMVNKPSKPTREYKDSDILRSMLIGILCGNPDFEAMLGGRVPESHRTREGKKEYIGETFRDASYNDIPMKRPVYRRRLKTVLSRMIATPGIVVTHVR